jgi:hypothetical protein
VSQNLKASQRRSPGGARFQSSQDGSGGRSWRENLEHLDERLEDLEAETDDPETQDSSLLLTTQNGRERGDKKYNNGPPTRKLTNQLPLRQFQTIAKTRTSAVPAPDFSAALLPPDRKPSDGGFITASRPFSSNHSYFKRVEESSTGKIYMEVSATLKFCQKEAWGSSFEVEGQYLQSVNRNITAPSEHPGLSFGACQISLFKRFLQEMA